jgi:hypothetical protein
LKQDLAKMHHLEPMDLNMIEEILGEESDSIAGSPACPSAINNGGQSISPGPGTDGE